MPTVNLRPMTPAEFQAWTAGSVESYAADLARAAQREVDDLLPRAREQFAELLPDGLDTADTWLLVIVGPGGADVGVLWIGPHRHEAGVAYVYDIEINEDERGRGYGRAAMLAAEDIVTAAGMTGIGLNVFGFNAGAQRLYESLGYRVVATQMAKPLQGATSPSS